MLGFATSIKGLQGFAKGFKQQRKGGAVMSLIIQLILLVGVSQKPSFTSE